MSRFLHLLALVALLLAPLSMHRAEAAPLHPSATPAGHCAGSEQAPEEHDQDRSADCALACSAMPSAGDALAALALPRPAFAAALASFFAGTAPGSDPPPPRFA